MVSAEERLIERKKVLNEILQTERTYVTNLNRMKQEYIAPIKQSNLLTSTEFQQIFSGNLNIIFNVNAEILKQLEQNTEEENAEKEITTSIGEIFKRLGPFLKTYTGYTNNYDKVATMLRNKKAQNSKFKEFLEKLEKKCKSGGGLDLNGYLIQPVQRIPRYNMLLTELLKFTDDDHPDRNNLSEALEQTKSVANWINQQIKDLENRTKLTRIQKSIRNPNPKECKIPVIVQPGRTFLKEGVLSFVSNDFNPKPTEEGKLEGEEEFYAYLFSDLLLVCRKMLESSIQRGLSVKKKTDDEKPVDFYEFHLFLHKAPVVWVFDCKNFGLFQVFGKKTLTFRASSCDEAAEWTSAVRDAMKALVDNSQYNLGSRIYAVSDVEHPVVQATAATVIQAVLKGLKGRRRREFLSKRRQTRLEKGTEIDKRKALELLQETSENLQRNQQIEERNIERRKTVLLQQKFERRATKFSSSAPMMRRESMASNKALRRPRGFSKMVSAAPLRPNESSSPGIRFRGATIMREPEIVRFLTVDEELGEVDLTTVHPALDYHAGEVNIEKELANIVSRPHVDRGNVGKTSIYYSAITTMDLEDAIVFDTGIEEQEVFDAAPCMDYYEEEIAFINESLQKEAKKIQPTSTKSEIKPIQAVHPQITQPIQSEPVTIKETDIVSTASEPKEEVSKQQDSVPSVSEEHVTVTVPDVAVQETSAEVEKLEQVATITEVKEAEKPTVIEQTVVENGSKQTDEPEHQPEPEPIVELKDSTEQVVQDQTAEKQSIQDLESAVKEDSVNTEEKQVISTHPVPHSTQIETLERVEIAIEEPIPVEEEEEVDDGLPEWKKILKKQKKLDDTIDRFEKDVARRKLDITQFGADVVVALVEKFRNNEIAGDRFKKEFNGASPQDQESLLSERKKAQKELEENMMALKKQLTQKKTPTKRLMPSEKTKALLQPKVSTKNATPSSTSTEPEKNNVVESAKVEVVIKEPVSEQSKPEPQHKEIKQTVKQESPQQQEEFGFAALKNRFANIEKENEEPQFRQPVLRKSSVKRESVSPRKVDAPQQASDFAFANLLGRFKTQEEESLSAQQDSIPKRLSSETTNTQLADEIQKAEQEQEPDAQRIQQEELDKQREEQEKLEQKLREEQEKSERERQQREEQEKREEEDRQKEAQKLEKERLEQLEQEKLLEEQERVEQARLEHQRLEEQKERERADQERLEQERLLHVQMEKERLEKEQKELLQREEENREREEQERLLEEQKIQERLEQARVEQERLEQQRLLEEQERVEQERLEQQRLEEQKEQERIERERLEQEKRQEEQERLRQEELQKQAQHDSEIIAENAKNESAKKNEEDVKQESDKKTGPISYRRMSTKSGTPPVATTKTAPAARNSGNRFKDKKKDFYTKLRAPTPKDQPEEDEYL